RAEGGRDRALVAWRDLELREDEPLPPLGECARGGRQRLPFLEDALERGKPVARDALGARGRDLLRPRGRGGRLELRPRRPGRLLGRGALRLVRVAPQRLDEPPDP